MYDFRYLFVSFPPSIHLTRVFYCLYTTQSVNFLPFLHISFFSFLHVISCRDFSFFSQNELAVITSVSAWKIIIFFLFLRWITTFFYSAAIVTRMNQDEQEKELKIGWRDKKLVKDFSYLPSPLHDFTLSIILFLFSFCSVPCQSFCQNVIRCCLDVRRGLGVMMFSCDIKIDFFGLRFGSCLHKEDSYWKLSCMLFKSSFKIDFLLWIKWHCLLFLKVMDCGYEWPQPLPPFGKFI